MSQAVGHQSASLAVLLGEVWDARTALSRGLVAEVTPDDELRDRACSLAQRLAHHDREFISRLLRTWWAVRDGATHAQTLELESEAQRWSLEQPNAKAALAAIRAQIRGT